MSVEFDYTPCAHGIIKAVRRVEGCKQCDAERVDALVAAQDARAFRARVVSTARAVLPQMAAMWISLGYAADADGPSRDAFRYAEAFERAADEYEQNGGSK